MNANRWHLLASAAFTVLLIAALAITASAQPDPAVGTWKLDLSQSKFNPGPPPKSGSLTYTPVGTGIKVVVETVAASGAKGHWEYTANYDGKDYPMTGNNADADSASLKWINASTVQVTNKKDGKRTLTHTRVVSDNGKTMTITSTGTNAAGQTVNNVQVFVKG